MKIQQVLKSKDPQAISKYVKLYLTQQPVQLQRICSQLQNYDTKVPQEKKSIKITLKNNKQKSSSHEKINFRQKYNTANYMEKKSSQYIIDRTKKIMRIMQDKLGLKINNNQQKQLAGMKLYQTNMEKINKPLKVHPGYHLSNNPKIIRQIERYKINKDYYQNNIEDAEINPQQYDHQMKQFLDRRKQTLHDILTKKNSQSTLGQFSKIQSKFLTSSLSKMPRSKSTAAIQKSQSLFNECDQYRSTCKLPKSLSVNYYEDLKHRIIDQKMDEIEEYMLKKTIKSSKQQILDKYTNSYLKMMTKAIAKPCKLNNHQKDLMKNQIKMRHIINFSEKNFQK